MCLSPIVFLRIYVLKDVCNIFEDAIIISALRSLFIAMQKPSLAEKLGKPSTVKNILIAMGKEAFP